MRNVYMNSHVRCNFCDAIRNCWNMCEECREECRVLIVRPTRIDRALRWMLVAALLVVAPFIPLVAVRFAYEPPAFVLRQPVHIAWEAALSVAVLGAWIILAVAVPVVWPKPEGETVVCKRCRRTAGCDLFPDPRTVPQTPQQPTTDPAREAGPQAG